MPIISDRNQIATLKESQKDCYICNEAAGRSERSVILTCDICSFWICKLCANIDPKVYEFLITNKVDLNFICPKCKDQLPKIKDLIKISQKQTEMEIELNDMKMHIDDNKKAIKEIKNLKVAERLSKIEEIIESNKLNDEFPPLPAMNAAAKKMQEEITTQQNTTEKLSIDIQEEKLKETKKLNLIIYGVPESTENAEDQMIEDFNTLKHLYLNKVELNTEDISSIIRLGRKKENQIRPIRITFPDFAKRREVLVNNNGLRLEGENYKECKCKINPGKHLHVNITTDKTQQERDAENQLREEMKTRRNNGEDVTIKKGKIVKRNQNTQARWAVISQNV